MDSIIDALKLPNNFKLLRGRATINHQRLRTISQMLTRVTEAVDALIAVVVGQRRPREGNGTFSPKIQPITSRRHDFEQLIW